jgi:hypothetical protein
MFNLGSALDQRGGMLLQDPPIARFFVSEHAG